MSPLTGERGERGFTLIEMIVVITLITILVALGVPSYRYVTTTSRVAGEVNALLGDLQFARAEAIKEGQPVSACPSSNGAACLSSSDWNSGWIVFSDVNGNGNMDAGQDTVLRVQKPFTSGDTFSANNGPRSSLTFNREGFAIGLSGAVTITLDDVTGTPTYTRCLEISVIGALTSSTC